MAKQLIVPGHGLIGEGAPHDAAGVRKMGSRWAATTGPGHAKCACGELSEFLPTTAARKRWHVAHKAEQALGEWLIGNRSYVAEIQQALDAIQAKEVVDPKSVVGILAAAITRSIEDRAQGKSNVLDDFDARMAPIKEILARMDGGLR